MLHLTRAAENPVLTPTEQVWENFLVFNPGAIVVNGVVYMIYRAMGKDDPKSYLGLAKSSDGIHFKRSAYPMYSGEGHPAETLGIEDPRVVEIDGTYFLTYTAVSEDPDAYVNPAWKEQIVKAPRIGLSTTKDFAHFIDYDVIIPDISGKNASFFPKVTNGEYWLMYREEAAQTYFAKSKDLRYWPEKYPLFEHRPGFWDSVRTGVGAPPIWTEKGWLLFYHGVDESNTYRLGIMFLDLNDPRKILYRSPEPIFEPERDYEKVGFVPNVIFCCGAVEKDGQYLLYYGAADEVIGLATVPKSDVLGIF